MLRLNHCEDHTTFDNPPCRVVHTLAKARRNGVSLRVLASASHKHRLNPIGTNPHRIHVDERLCREWTHQWLAAREYSLRQISIRPCRQMAHIELDSKVD
jgi:hypothetical protein